MTPRLVLPSLVAAFSIATFAPTLAKAPTELDALTIVDINHAFDSGSLTSEKLVQLCLARIQSYDRQGRRFMR